MVTLHVFPACRIQRMQKIEIDIICLQPLELFFKIMLGIRFLFDQPNRQLVRQQIAFARELPQGCGEDRFAFSFMIVVGCIIIGDPGPHCCFNHLVGAYLINLFVRMLRQAHCAKTE